MKKFHAHPRIVGLILAVLSSREVAAQFGDWPDIFKPTQMRTLSLDMDPEDWVTIQNDDPYDEIPQIEVPASFWAEGESPILVSVRRKSANSLNNGTSFSKVSLKIDINDFVVGQSWHGLKKLSLENGDDQDVVSEGLAWRIERLASGTQGYGYDAGRFAWVRLFINGVYTGVYVNVEQRDKRFLENRGIYLEGQTWLYKKEGGIRHWKSVVPWTARPPRLCVIHRSPLNLHVPSPTWPRTSLSMSTSRGC
jgi:hypothetical protein